VASHCSLLQLVMLLRVVGVGNNRFDHLRSLGSRTGHLLDDLGRGSLGSLARHRAGGRGSSTLGFDGLWLRNALDTHELRLEN